MRGRTRRRWTNDDDDADEDDSDDNTEGGDHLNRTVIGRQYGQLRHQHPARRPGAGAAAVGICVSLVTMREAARFCH
jgi:hypothetical protein